MERIRLTAPALDFWVELCLISRDNRWLAVALLDDESEIGLGHSRDVAIRGALRNLGNEAAEALLRGTAR